MRLSFRHLPLLISVFFILSATARSEDADILIEAVDESSSGIARYLRIRMDGNLEKTCQGEGCRSTERQLVPWDPERFEKTKQHVQEASGGELVADPTPSACSQVYRKLTITADGGRIPIFSQDGCSRRVNSTESGRLLADAFRAFP